MADFKVSAERVEILPHPTADRLEIAKVGMFSLVVGKGQYVDGDIVVFAPKRAILPEEIRGGYKNEETGLSYLKKGAIVRSIRLRGELSEGVTLDKYWAASKVIESRTGVKPVLFDPESIFRLDLLGEDISADLGITEDVPHIPAQFAGVQANIKATAISLHDCESIRLHSREFVEGEAVVVSEKLHGTQINIIIHEDGETVEIGSKGLIKKGIVLEDAPGNFYWRAFRASGIHDIIKKLFPGQFVQVMGEVIPAQSGFDYGTDPEGEPVLKIFRLEVGRERYCVAALDPEAFKPVLDMWVPWQIVPFDLPTLEKMAKGMETVSGKQRHIKEGVVVEPYPSRPAKRGGWPPIVKIINPKYKGDDEDMS